MRKGWQVVSFATLFAGPAAAQTPMQYLTSNGLTGRTTVPLLWGLLVVAIAVVIIISVLVLIGALRRRDTREIELVPLTETHASSWISIGVGISTVVILGLVVWTSVVMAKIANPPSEPRLTIEVRGHQWWWEVIYHDDQPSRMFTTANEIHVPVGVPVRFELKSMDVIHSFWIPKLGGKTDVIPGQTNITWLEADTPGVFRGQCSEYCGQQHAHMALAVYADQPASFERWKDAQLNAAGAPTDARLQAGEQNFILKCGACHTVRGTPANGHVGPDLTHLMGRSTIAGGFLPNNPGYLSGWIANPQRLKPGAMMPDLNLSGPELASIRSFVLTLR